MNNLFKRLTVFVLVFSFLVSPLSVFGYSIDVDFDNSFDEEQTYNINSDTYDLTENDIELLILDNIKFIIADEYEEDFNNQNSRAIINPVTVAAIKSALTRLGASAAFKSMTTHALQQANIRKVT